MATYNLTSGGMGSDLPFGKQGNMVHQESTLLVHQCRLRKAYLIQSGAQSLRLAMQFQQIQVCLEDLYHCSLNRVPVGLGETKGLQKVPLIVAIWPLIVGIRVLGPAGLSVAARFHCRRAFGREDLRRSGDLVRFDGFDRDLDRFDRFDRDRRDLGSVDLGFWDRSRLLLLLLGFRGARRSAVRDWGVERHGTAPGQCQHWG